MVSLVLLGTGGLLGTWAPQDLLDLEEILEDRGPMGPLDRTDVKEIQACVEVQGPKVLSAPQGPEDGQVYLDFLVRLVLMDLQDHRGQQDSKVLQALLDFMDWTD